MRVFLGELQQNLKGIWSRLDGGQRLVVGAVTGAVALGLMAMVWFASQPSYVVAFTGSSGDDMREAKRVLAQSSVQFVPDDSGRSLMVERKFYSVAQNALFEGGLIEGKQTSILEGSFIEDAATKKWRIDNALRAIAESAVADLDGIVAVKITASRPKRSPFRNQDAATAPRATVSLRLKPGVPFESVARAAASLASSELMVPLENVEVLNNGGARQRWRYDPNRDTGGSSEFLSLQRRLAEERTANAQDALERLYPGKTRVVVNVELDPLWEIKTEKLLPTDPIALTDSSTKDTTENIKPVRAQGDPSLAAIGEPQQTTGSTTSSETRDRTFLESRGEMRSGKFAPEIKRLSVALFYDRSLTEGVGFNQEDLENIVKRSVGYNADRDGVADEFSTLVADFPAEQPTELVDPGPGMSDVALQWAPAVGQVLGVLLVLLFLRSLLKRNAAPAKAEASATPAAIPVAPSDLTTEEQQQHMRREIERAIATDPAALARLLENWVTEAKT